MPRLGGGNYYRYWHFWVVRGRLYQHPIYCPSSKVMQTPSRPISAANWPEALKCAQRIKCLLLDEGHRRRQPRAIGIAAPQLGYNLRLIGMRMSNHHLLLLQNPTIMAHSPIRRASFEGCLSVPGEQRQVFRYNEVLVEFQTPNDPTRTYQRRLFRGLASFVIQHELNHLEARPWWRSSLGSRTKRLRGG